MGDFYLGVDEVWLSSELSFVWELSLHVDSTDNVYVLNFDIFKIVALL